MQSRFCRIRTYLHAGVFLLASCLGTHLFAQSASVSGQVLDSSGAAVPGAKVALVNAETQVTLNTVSDAKGIFLLPPVVPGQYQVTVTAAGYSTWVESSITLEVGEKDELNPVLNVGSVSTTIAVTSAAPEINTEDPDKSTVTESSLVANIPLDVRNPLQETNFTVGVVQSNSLTAGTNASSESTTNTFYLNGTKGGESDILIDGATDTIDYDTHAAAAIPGLDAVQEFRIYTAAYAPEFGHVGSGIQSYSIKSGTNDYHGGAWEYYRSDVMDANGYNANAANQKRPSFERNQFGGQIGGPVVIPKVYNGHDKTFFFGSYEELRDSTPGAGFTTTVPTALERTGDFSQSANPIYDPSTTQSLTTPPNSPNGMPYTCSNGGSGKTNPNTSTTTPATGYYRCQFIYQGRLNVIDPSRLNPVAQALLAKYPLPNTVNPSVGAGNDENNFFSDAPNIDIDYSYDIRIDHKFTDKQSVSGHIDFFDNNILYGAVFGQSSLTPNNGNNLLPDRNIMVDHTWVLSPTVIFDHHVSWARMESHRASLNPLGTAPFGIPASAAPGVTASFTPQVEATTNQLGELGNSEPYERNPNSVYQYAASVSWLKGIHTFKFGTDIRRYVDQLDDPQLLTVNTSRTFTGGPYANSPAGTSGNAVAELLLGQATVTSGYAPRVDFRHPYYAAYAEDTAKITPKLTVTGGVRYDFEGGDVAAGNQLSYLNTTSPSPIAGLVGGVGIVGLNGASRELQVPGKLHFAPRLGIAYALDKNTVVHAGAGIFWHPTGTWQTNPASYGFTRKSTSVDAEANGFSPLYNLSNPFPSGLPAPYGNNPSALPGNNTESGPLSIELGQTISGNPRKQSVSYQEDWSLDVQRALPSHFVVTATYSGSTGVHLLGAIQLNQLTDANLALGTGLNKTVPNPFYNVITDTSSVLSAPTVQQGYLLRAYPQFLNFEALNSGWGHSNYQAGQLTVEHRLSQGLSMLLGYTYSKMIDDVGEVGTTASIQDNGCHACERSIADLDQTNVLRVSGLYQLPFGPQKPFLNQGVLGRLVGGWELGGTYQYDTGQPLALTSPIQSGSLNGGTNSTSANVMRPTLVAGQSISKKVINPKTGELSSFNPAAFTQTGTYAFGNAPRYLSDARWPAFLELDALLEKNTKINERMGFTVRFEALNALNNVVFGSADVGAQDSNFGYNPHTQQNTPRIAQVSGRFTF
jgi:Carboxypeptidase regulatory-like domain